MPVRKANAEWNGNLKEGAGTMSFGSGAFEGAYTYASRFEEGAGTNPEELIGAAHAGCFSMQLAAGLGNSGYKPEFVRTEARVHLEGGAIQTVELFTEARVPDIDESAFREVAEKAKRDCKVTKALASVETKLDAKLV
jgi:lipoyl-dependent peroxiredoxin